MSSSSSYLKTRDYLENFNNKKIEQDNCYKGYEIKDILAKGNFSIVYNACMKNKCNYIIKQIFEGIDIMQEIKIGIHLGLLGISPKIYAYWFCDGSYFIVYKKINGLTLKDYLFIYKDKLKSSKQFSDKMERKITKIVEKMHNHSIAHNDLHHENFLLETDVNGNIKKVYIIDFGLSSVFNSPSDARRYYEMEHNKQREEFYKKEIKPFLYKQKKSYKNKSL